MTSIGSTLKEARNKKTLSLEEVHAKIKIHPRVLQLLEEEKFDKLPSPLFAKSFLKSYAEFLEVNPEEVMQAYERAGVKDPEQTIYIRPAEGKNEAFDLQRFFVTAPLLGIVIFAIAGGVYYFSRPKPQPAIYRRGAVSASASARKTDNGRGKPVPATQTTRPKEAPVKKPDDRLRSAEAGNFPVIDKKMPIEFELKAMDAVWVEITVDGKILFHGILKKGAVENWNANEAIEIWTGNAASMFLSVNKTPIGSPGKGTLRRLQISRDGVRILPKESR